MMNPNPDSLAASPEGAVILEAEHLMKCYTSNWRAHLARHAQRESSPASMLNTLSNSSKSHGIIALNDVSLRVREGECLAIIGASGSGKTTLTRILLGLRSADSGIVRYRGEELSKASPALKRIRQESSIVFQDPFSSLDPRWTVGRSIGETLELQTNAPSRAEIERRSREAMRRVSLDDSLLFDRYPMDLSGGQAQRVAIARALVSSPRVLLADEAMSAIDMSARIQILHTLEAIRSAKSVHPMTMLLVSHDLGMVQHIADSIVVLRDGAVIEYGKADAMLNNPQQEYTKQLIAAATLK
ncbi:ABC transporter ATP-binding protein [Bifidobacterium sp.]|jgi:peptide/nickel transport system ATP-binding protein|uniref:ABC transporter ATP-binding protein n=1 Tax=Bifidobacterium sp. TaxID=41200 RepID=UPI0025BD3160|nr:ATP-binding cassette domain-containing protein [Bifidobacterium sp.]MCI1635450.1 ATP-binding cassette domain-containing protein [Bifidobacterium sp.]